MGTRVPVSELSIANGLKEQRLFQLKKIHKESELVLVIVKQIGSLINFLNVKTTFDEEQILDTAEIIVGDYDDFSFAAIMDCFHKIKTAKAPFNKKFYESIDGRKVLEFFNTYRDAQSEYLEERHKDQKQLNDVSLKMAFKVNNRYMLKLKGESLVRLTYESGVLSKIDFKDKQASKNEKLIKVLRKVSRYEKTLVSSLKNFSEVEVQKLDLTKEEKDKKKFAEDMSALNKKIRTTSKKKAAVEPQRNASPIDELCKEWLAEFDKLREEKKLPKRIVTPMDFLRLKQSELKIENKPISDAKMRDWAAEFWELRDTNKLPDGVDTYQKYFEFKTF